MSRFPLICGHTLYMCIINPYNTSDLYIDLQNSVDPEQPLNQFLLVIYIYLDKHFNTNELVHIYIM